MLCIRTRWIQTETLRRHIGVKLSHHHRHSSRHSHITNRKYCMECGELVQIYIAYVWNAAIYFMLYYYVFLVGHSNCWQIYFYNFVVCENGFHVIWILCLVEHSVYPFTRCNDVAKKKNSLRPQYRHTQTIHLTDVKCLFALKVSWNDIIKMHRQKSTTITNGLRNLVTCFILICFFQYSKRFQVNNLKVDTILSVCIFFSLYSYILSVYTPNARDNDWISHDAWVECVDLIKGLKR